MNLLNSIDFQIKNYESFVNSIVEKLGSIDVLLT